MFRAQLHHFLGSIEDDAFKEVPSYGSHTRLVLFPGTRLYIQTLVALNIALFYFVFTFIYLCLPVLTLGFLCCLRALLHTQVKLTVSNIKY